MAVTGITLAEPVSGRVSTIWPRQGVAYQGHQFAPTVRAVSDDRVAGDGQVDSTAFLSAGAFTLTLRLYDGTRAVIDDIGSYLHPSLRPVLTVTDDEWSDGRTLTLRYDNGFPPVELGVGRTRNIALSWQVPNGKWEAATPVSAVVNAQTIVDPNNPTPQGLSWGTTGVLWTLSGALWLPAQGVTGPSEVVNPGGSPVDWTARLYGPCSGPKLANDLAGLTLEWDGSVVLGAGEYIDVDSSTWAAVLNSDPSQVPKLNFATSKWWQMLPGTNLIRYYPDTAGAGCQAQITFKPGWILG
jgi:hypothetical protein